GREVGRGVGGGRWGTGGSAGGSEGGRGGHPRAARVRAARDGAATAAGPRAAPKRSLGIRRPTIRAAARLRAVAAEREVHLRPLRGRWFESLRARRRERRRSEAGPRFQSPLPLW